MPQAFWSASACRCVRPCSSMCAPSTDIVNKQRPLTYQSSVVLAVSGSPHLVVAAGNLSSPACGCIGLYSPRARQTLIFQRFARLSQPLAVKRSIRIADMSINDLHLVDAAGPLEGLRVRLHQAVQLVHVRAQRQLDPVSSRERQQPPVVAPPLGVHHPLPVVRALQGGNMEVIGMR